MNKLNSSVASLIRNPETIESRRLFRTLACGTLERPITSWKHYWVGDTGREDICIPLHTKTRPETSHIEHRDRSESWMDGRRINIMQFMELKTAALHLWKPCSDVATFCCPLRSCTHHEHSQSDLTGRGRQHSLEIQLWAGRNA